MQRLGCFKESSTKRSPLVLACGDKRAPESILHCCPCLPNESEQKIDNADDVGDSATANPEPHRQLLENAQEEVPTLSCHGTSPEVARDSDVLEFNIGGKDKLSVTPSTWDAGWGDHFVASAGHGWVTLKSGEEDEPTPDNEAAVIFDSQEKVCGLKVSSFAVLVERGSEAQIGWSALDAMDLEDEKLVRHSSKHTSWGLDLSENPRFWCRGNERMPEDASALDRANVRANDVVVVCWHQDGVHSTEVEGSDPDAFDAFCFDSRACPAISFKGTVTISNVQHHCPDKQ